MFITHDNQHHPLNVLPKDDTCHTQNNTLPQHIAALEAFASDIPNDWRDGSLLVGGVPYSVIDIEFDVYNVKGDNY